MKEKKEKKWKHISGEEKTIANHLCNHEMAKKLEGNEEAKSRRNGEDAMKAEKFVEWRRNRKWRRKYGQSENYEMARAEEEAEIERHRRNDRSGETEKMAKAKKENNIEEKAKRNQNQRKRLEMLKKYSARSWKAKAENRTALKEKIWKPINERKQMKKIWAKAKE